MGATPAVVAAHAAAIGSAVRHAHQQALPVFQSPSAHYLLSLLHGDLVVGYATVTYDEVGLSLGPVLIIENHLIPPNLPPHNSAF